MLQRIVPFNFTSKTCLLAIGLLVFCISKGTAQILNSTKEISQFTHDIWGDEQNYISGGSLSLVQGVNGYLWIGTYNGVFRFDGVDFRQFSKETDTIISNNNFPTICLGNNNEIWAGSNGGGLYQFNKNAIKKFSVENGLPSNTISHIYKDEKGRILIGTPKGLSIYSDGHFSNYTQFIRANDTINSVTINTILALENDKYLIGTNIGLYQFEEPFFTAVSLETDYGQIEVSSVIKTRDKKILIGTYGKGIFQIKDGLLSPLKLPIGVDKISHLMEDSNGAIWIAHQAGLIRYSQGKFSAFPNTYNNYEEAVECIIEDREGSIWFTRYNGGLERLKDAIFVNLSTNEGISDKIIHCIYEDKDSSKWIGTANGLNHLKNGKITQYTKENGKIIGNLVRDVFRDSKGRLWIATYSGLTKIENNRTTHFTVKDGLSSDLVRLIFEDTKGSLWIGTRNGLNSYEAGSFIQYDSKNGLSNSFILSMHEMPNGALWIGTSGGGINIYKNGQFDQRTTSDGLPSNVIFRMHQDEEGAIWIATNNGLCKYYEGLFYSNFKTDKGYLNAALYQVLEDKHQELWITSDFGIINVKKSELNNYLLKQDISSINEIHYKQLDGLKRSECTGAAKSIVASDQTIWFATLGSVAILNVDDSLQNTVPPPVVIESIKVDDVAINFSKGSKTSIDKDSKVIEFNYTALSLKTPSKVKFKYRLLELDEEWIDAGNERSISYRNLDYGTYTFEVTACNNNGVWNKTPASQAIYIEPNLYQTTPFILVSLLLFVTLVFGINTLRIRRIKREKIKLQQLIDDRTIEVIAQNEEISAQRDEIEERSKRLEEAQGIIKQKNKALKTANSSLEDLVNKRTQQLEQSNKKLFDKNRELDLFIYKSAHDLRGPIARIQGLIQLGKTDKTNVELYFEKLESTSNKMSSLLTRTVRVHDVNSRKFVLVHINITRLIDEIAQSFNKPNAIKIINTSPREIVINTDLELIKIALENLIENAVKFSSRKRDPFVYIEIISDADTAKIIIKNNGPEIPPEFETHIFKIFTVANDILEGAGLGLYEVKIIMERLHGKIELLHSSPQETVFELSIPI